MTYALPLLRPLLYEQLPNDVKPHVAIMNRYWITDEAASLYARAAAIASLEQHSPIMGISSGVPSCCSYVSPTDTRKGRMWYDLGMEDWVFEIDATSGARGEKRLVQIGRDLPAARQRAIQARSYSQERMAAMIERAVAAASSPA